MVLHKALQCIFPLADANDSLICLDDIKNILYGTRKNTVYKAAFSRDLKKDTTIPAFDLLANSLFSYFSSRSTETQASYDTWHYDTCKVFLDELNRCLPEKKSYGKAQKCVNMAMKYLYCCHDASIFFEYNKFDYCHIALDGYTYKGLYPLSFYRDYVYPWKYGCSPQNLSPWSNLCFQEYTTIVKDIREKFDSFPRTFNNYLKACNNNSLYKNIPLLSNNDDRILTPFEAEFFLWEMCKSNLKSELSSLF